MKRVPQMVSVAREIFSQVRTAIVMNMRFLDMAVFRLKPVPAPLTLATDGNFLYYNPRSLLKKYSEESNAVTRDYMHVLLHCIFRHPFVNTLLDHQCWDLACDIAVEAMIGEMDQPILSVDLAKNRNAVIAELRKQVRPLTAEKLYRYFQSCPPKPGWAALFMADDHSVWYDRTMRQCLSSQAQMAQSQQQQRQPQQKDPENGTAADDDEADGNDGGAGGEQPDQDAQRSTGSGTGPGESPGDSGAAANPADEWRDISEHIQMDLETFAKQQGYKAGHLEQRLSALNRERYDYEAFLKKFAVMGEVMKINDDEFDYIFYTYGLKLFGNMPLIEPLEYKEVRRIRDFVIAIDTSGSTSGELVQKFLNRTYNILQSTESFFSRVNIYIVQCDAEIQEVVRITKKEEFDDYLSHMTVKGLGGTDFRPVFTFVDQLVREKAFTNLRGMIYFTDGMGTFPAKKPDYQTAFVFIRDEFNNPDVPPWAIRLVLEKEEI